MIPKFIFSHIFVFLFVFLVKGQTTLIVAGFGHPTYRWDDIFMTKCAENLRKNIFTNAKMASFSTGKEFLLIFNNCNTCLSDVFVFGHASQCGLFVRYNAGFYIDNYVPIKNGDTLRLNNGAAFLSEFEGLYKNKPELFCKNACIWYLGCSTASGYNSIAHITAEKLHLNTVGFTNAIDLYNVDLSGVLIKSDSGYCLYNHWINNKLISDTLGSGIININEMYIKTTIPPKQPTE